MRRRRPKLRLSFLRYLRLLLFEAPAPSQIRSVISVTSVVQSADH